MCSSRPRRPRGRTAPCSSSRSGSSPRCAAAATRKRALADLCRMLLEQTPQVCLFVRPENEPALALYDSIGMRRTITYRSLIFA